MTPEHGTAVPVEDAEVSETVKRAVWRLDRELKASVRFGAKANRQLHQVMVNDVRRAEKRAERAERRLENVQARAQQAERRARQAERRAERAERELAEARDSATWRAGRVLVAVPARLKRWRRS